MIPILATLLLKLLFPVAAARACDGVSDHAYRIVAGVALDALPEELRNVLGQHRDKLGHTSVDPDLRRLETEKGFADDAHYIWLDVASSDELRSLQRGIDLADFPKTRAEFDSLCHRFNRKSCGSLPWAIEVQFHDVVAAFETGQVNRVVQALAPMFHLVTDAAMPLNATADGVGGPARGRRSSGPSSQALAVDRLHERLAYEVRIWPERVTPIDEPVDAVFEMLVETHKAVAALRALESRRPRAGRSRDGSTTHRAMPQDEQWAPMLEDRLKAGALLAARLVASAWEKAGKPELAVSRSSRQRTVTAGVGDVEASGFAGSRDSTVFHRATCAHVARIKPENLVRFDSLDDAVAMGRKPCRSCKPASD